MDKKFVIIVYEDFVDVAKCWIEPYAENRTLGEGERLHSSYSTREEAEDALDAVEEYCAVFNKD